MYILYQAEGCAEQLREKGVHSTIAYRNWENSEIQIYIRKELNIMRVLRSHHRKIFLTIHIV